ncbi:MAG: isoleucine--tRNA ligase [Candidatus Thermoplasmatota archaeon]|nr:isoleucine--tRNA ligase [Candidatus Thermoplasmatota archaeon]
MIQSPQQKYNPKEVEARIQRFWKDTAVFKKSIEQRKGCTPYVFLEGPPTANGLPHPGHVLTRVMKDLILRYETMNGHYILRKAGWDTHGLPVEIEVEKKLGLEDKQAIEAYGVAKFNEECKKSVFRYEHAWVEMTQRIAFWLDMDHPYITLKNEYIESVWWSLQQAWKKKLLYRGHKVVPYCPRCGTALSTHEISQGYKVVEDPSIFVKFKVKNEDAYFLAWTTTPWTLISNVALAVHPKEPYIKIRLNGEVLILAEERAASLLKGQEYDMLDRFMGKDLEQREYEPLFSYVTPEKRAWYVVLADFVTMEDGTGIVHIAPAFGEDDYNVGCTYDLPVVQLVKLDGTFPEEVTLWRGQFVKDADPSIIQYLEDRGLLAGTKTHSHEYPFCWRCDSPLLYYAMESWFIAMSKVQEALVKNNNQIAWYPPHLQQGRFGDFIREVKDWALSRDRYWGTPLPIWTCSNKKCNHIICIGSVQELRDISETFPDEYDLHKPFVDKLSVICPKCKGRMIREKEVIDCWYDSGSSFFAQWHYPFEHSELFKENFPIDFISEALDQTRGWFYSLLAISTFLFDTNPYKTVLTLGLVLDKENQKMSKSKKNYVDPTLILDHEGADALRWYLISANAPWMSTRFYEEAVKDTLGKFILTLWNSYNFFTTYAVLDSFDPTEGHIPLLKRGLLDQWISSRFHKLVKEVKGYMKSFESHKAARAIESFLIDDFSNWYLRRSRKRLWVEETTPDKLSGYFTMYEVFVGLSQLLAPFIPFITEEIYQNLRTAEMPESVHLCDYPAVHEKAIHDDLEKGMIQIRAVVESGRTLRSKINIKGRQPLSAAWIVCSADIEQSTKPLLELVKEELNVKKIQYAKDTTPFMVKTMKPKFSHLGPKYKEKAKSIVQVLETKDMKSLYTEFQKKKEIIVSVGQEKIRLTCDDFEVVEQEKEHVAKAILPDITLFLDTTVTPALEAEGLARELIRRIQSMRKELNLDVEDRIITEITLDEGKQTALMDWKNHIKEETRSKNVSFVESSTGMLLKTWIIDELTVIIGIRK